MESHRRGSNTSESEKPHIDNGNASAPTRHTYSRVPHEDVFRQNAKGSVGSRRAVAGGADDEQHPPLYQPHAIAPLWEGMMTWWRELLASAVSLAALVATFATLYHYHGKPSPEWPHLISINAILSIYMLLLRAGMAIIVASGLARQKWNWFGSERPLYDIALFDEATRGAYGSLILLQRTHFKHLLTSLGCLLAVMVLLVDPFAQQVLRYDECSVPKRNGLASVPRTNIFQGSGLDEGYTVAISSAVQDAITVGITAPGNPIDVQCSTGNCTFPIYDTLGFCSSCEDVSHNVHFRHGNTSYQTRSSVSRRTVTSYIPGYDNAKVTFAQDLPSSSCTSCEQMSSNFSNINADIGPVQLVIGLPVLPGYDGRPSPMDPNTGRPPTGCNTVASRSTWRCRGYGAAKCQIYPCIRTYNTSVENGAVQETLVATAGSLASNNEANYTDSRVFGLAGQAGYGSEFYSTVNKTCLDKSERESLRQAGYPVEDTKSVWMPYRFVPYPNDDFRYSRLTPNASAATKFPESMIQRGCVYMMRGDGIDIGPVFDGTLIGNNILGSGVVFDWTGPQILQTIYNWGNTSFERVESTFQNISDSLTNYIRLHPNDTNGVNNARLSEPAVGTAEQTRTCLKIRWAWLALPVTLVCLSIFFLVAILCSTSPLPFRTSDWKSSTLPLIYHGMEFPPEQVRDRRNHMDLERLDGMEEHAKRMHVTLGIGGNKSAHLQLGTKG